MMQDWSRADDYWFGEGLKHPWEAKPPRSCYDREPSRETTREESSKDSRDFIVPAPRF